jgi:hypothetical protein
MYFPQSFFAFFTLTHFKGPRRKKMEKTSHSKNSKIMIILKHFLCQLLLLIKSHIVIKSFIHQKRQKEEQF